VLFTCSLSGTVVAVGAALSRLTGRPPSELPGTPAYALLHPSSHVPLLEVLRAARYGSPSGSMAVVLRHADGSGIELAATWSVLAGGSGDTQLAFLVVDPVADPAAERQAEARLGAAVVRDGLAQLPSRGLVFDRVMQALIGAERSTAVLLVGLDRFGLVNDSRGRVVGDQVLAGVDARLRAAVSGDRTVVRFGGDEFVVICADTDEEEAHAVALKLLGVLSRPFPVGGAPVHATASIGVAAAPAEGALSATDLVRRADSAVHAAKNAGGGRVHVFDRTLGEDVDRRRAMAADLRTALADDALHLEYQPIVDPVSEALVGLEALARWTHPERGPLPASTVAGIAELAGLAPELDRWLVRRALRGMADLRAAGDVPDDAYLAVTLSATDLTDALVADELLTWTGEVGLPPDKLVLEISGTAIRQDTALAERLLQRLRRQGFRWRWTITGTGAAARASCRSCSAPR